MRRGNLSVAVAVIQALVTVWFAATCGSLSAQNTAWPFSVNISTEQGSVRSGDVVWIKIILTNVSTREIRLQEISVEEDYAVKCENGPIGYPARETPHRLDVKARHIPADSTVRAQVEHLQPGQTIVDYIPLSDLYDMRQPGLYTIQLKRDIPKELGGGGVKSNTITLAVTK